MSDKEKYIAAPDRYSNSVGYNFCGKSGLKLPRLSLGCGITSAMWTMPQKH